MFSGMLPKVFTSIGNIAAATYTEKIALILIGIMPLEKKGAAVNIPNILTRISKNI
jgi:hypothetical protein